MVVEMGLGVSEVARDTIYYGWALVVSAQELAQELAEFVCLCFFFFFFVSLISVFPISHGSNCHLMEQGAFTFLLLLLVFSIVFL